MAKHLAQNSHKIAEETLGSPCMQAMAMQAQHSNTLFSHAAHPVLNVTARDQELPQVQMFIGRVWLVIKANMLIQSAYEFDPLLGSSSGKSRDRVRAAIGSMYHEAASDTPPDAFPEILVALLFAVPPEPTERVELSILWQALARSGTIV